MSGWSLDLRKWGDGAIKDANRAIRKVTLEAFTRIIMKTPVHFGHARGNWQITEGEPSIDELPSRFNSKVGTSVIARTTTAVLAWLPANGKILMYNNVPYIMVLERGRVGNRGSSQAPNGMVAVTMAEIGAITDTVAAEVLNG